ncbi:cobalamin B12-binding domain-containing protein, partial [bacterium]|nr:cobalamin B12-binding domain-containing protein [bacterium]
MKIAIIYPNLDATPQSLDMGVAYLATFIDERTHHQVRIIDLTFHKRHWRAYCKEQVETFTPDVVGISVVSLYFDYARRIARFVKEFHDVPIIVGGYHAMMSPGEMIQV